MLREIMIENVAVIEKAGVQFGAGLNVLSGETGAGKSILIDSINAILGNRTSRELVRSHTPKARIRAVFTGLDAGVLKKLEAAGYEAKSCFYTARSAQTAKAYAASTGCPPRRPWCARYAPG